MPVDYAALAKRLQATPADAQADFGAPGEERVSFESLNEKYGDEDVSAVDASVTTPLMTGAPKKPGGFFAGVARAVAPLGESIGTAPAGRKAKEMEAETTARGEELAKVAISLIKNPKLNAQQKARALRAMQISKDAGVIAQSGAFETTGRQVAGQALGTLGSLVAGSGSGLAARLGLKGGAGLAARALGEGLVSGATIGAGAGLAEGEGPWSQALKTGAIAAAIPVIGSTFGRALPKMANALERINLRLTPVQKTNLGSRLDEVTEFIRKNDIVGEPATRFEKVTDIYRGMERKIQNFLAKNHNITVSRDKLLQELEDLKVGYRSDRDSVAIDKQIDGIKKLLTKRFPDDIRVTRLNDLKRSTYEGAYSRTGNNKVLDDIEHAAGDIFRRNIEEATAGLTIDGLPIGAFNKEYGTAINARKLLKTATGRPEIGLVGRIISTMVGGSVGGATGGVAGGAVGTAVGQNVGGLVAGTAARSGLANILTKAERGASGIGKSLRTSGGRRTVDQLKATALAALAQR